MQRIDTPDGLFRDGNPGTGELGTILSAAWLNAIQAELISVLTDRGISVDPAKSNQLLEAIKKIAWGGAGSARPSSLAGYGITDALSASGEVANLNAITKQGVCAYTQTTANAPNLFGVVQTISNLTNIPPDGTNESCWVFQIAFGTSGERYTRQRINAGSWSGWRSIGDGDVDRAEVTFFATSSAPLGWLKCNGAAVSRTAYSGLFAIIGTSFGAGDGSTTFNLPDLRAEFIRGWDDGRGVDAGRGFGTMQPFAIQLHTHAVLDSDNIGSTLGVFHYGERGTASNQTSNEVAATGGTETRPRNVAMLACIKY